MSYSNKRDEHELWCIVMVTGGLEGPCECGGRSVRSTVRTAPCRGADGGSTPPQTAIPIDSEPSFDGVPLYWDCMNLGGVYSNQHANLTEHVLKRGLEPYVRFVLLQWKDMNL